MINALTDAVAEIQANYDRPTWWQNRLAHRVVAPLQARTRNGTGIDVVDERWDTLIVLDACRADLFEEVAELDDYDDYTTRESAGSATVEWAHANFDRQALTDTVYVTANPVVSREVRTAFHRFVEVWRDEFDSSIGTVPAPSVTEAALEAHEADPDKRLVVHYLQPHYPFVEDPELRYADFGGTEEVDVADVNDGATDVWEAVGLGLADPDVVWDAYRRNLRHALDAVQPLVERLPGRTVVTSDHGNMYGERMSPFPVPLYGHVPGLHYPALRDVPWAVVDGESRAGTEAETADVRKQLRSLGYVD